MSRPVLNLEAIELHPRPTAPAGGPEMVHQIVNTGLEKLRYFAVSTRLSPEIAEYPDTGRFGLLADLAPGADGKQCMMMFVGRENDTLDYWQGE